MKKLGTTIFILILLMSLPICVYAKEYYYNSAESGAVAVNEAWDKLIDSLPDEVKNELVGISPEDISGTADLLREKTSITYWIRTALKYLTGSISDIVSKFIPMISLMIFMAAVQIIMPSSASQNLQKALLTYTGLVTALILYRQTYDIITITSGYLDRICNIMNLMTPIMEAIYLSCGALTKMAVSTQAVMLFVTVAGNFTGYLLTPMTNILFTLSAVSSVCDEAKMTHLTGSLRKLIMRMIQIFTIFFSFMLGAQSILAQSADSLGMKTARFALGSFIPIAGGTIAEALSTLREGMSLIKNAAGIGGILIVILLLLPDILSLAIYKFTLYLTGTAAEILKLDKFSGLINEIRGIVELLIAIVLFTSLMFIIVLIIFTKSQVS